MHSVGIVGLGLIGGSLARTIRLHAKSIRVYGTDILPETMQLAHLMDAIDEDLTEDNLPEMDLILVALYPEAIVTWIEEHRSAFKPGAIVIDCGGVKETIVSRIQPLADTWHFIGGHPMSGREISGFKASRDDLFDKASMILTPSPAEDLQVLQCVRNFFSDIGFRRIQFTTPRTHDEMIAYTSQLAHVVSSAYVKSELAQKHRGFSAGSFADMTRVAKVNENMWTELFFLNRENLLPEIDGLIARLTDYRDALDREDREGMRALLREGRETKEGLEEN
ncbi:MAG: prephenate dehydrogenase/arogenate dehydrogenase family protein [Clostridia bacterium]|nr:prephenate dehydrogenase/arogenate dehydrogenase family protein [Clostridia bacterium]MBR1683883.1 prephenate dehydrogenase/arogenate dehydrogenase family protein [Clostridia bacterium]